MALSITKAPLYSPKLKLPKIYEGYRLSKLDTRSLLHLSIVDPYLIGLSRGGSGPLADWRT